MGVLRGWCRRDWPRLAAERRSAHHSRPALRPLPAATAPGTGSDSRLDGRRGARSREEQSEVTLRQIRQSDGDGAARPRVLVVDDDDALCEAIRESLRDGYAVASAPHGAAALDLVKVHEPALILLDLRMPIMDGWSFVQRYRRVAVAPAAIVVMSSAADLPAIAAQLGADGHLPKPFALDGLHRLVAQQLGRRANAAAGDLSRADRPSSPPLT